MVVQTVLLGSAPALRAALMTIKAQPDVGANVIGVGIVGKGDGFPDALACAANWDALDLKKFSERRLLLAEMPPPAVVKALLARAVEVGAQLWVIEERRTRRLELDDLFDRPLQALDWSRIGAAITGKRVLITGGGGSIGLQLARRIVSLSPHRLTLLDSSELNLFNAARAIPAATLALADIRGSGSMRRWFDREKPDVVFHAAALKQVPLVEQFASEGLLTNVCGLRNVVEAAHANDADFIFVSTDKAVSPSGVMGATKRLGELYCQALDRRGARRAIPVRLGNVLGSAGSVAPVFEAQVAAGGPLTVTDPAATRFFMSIPQAAKALLQACAAGLEADHQRGMVYTIDMGDALRVVDLARDMIRLAGRQPERDIKIIFTGLRPGERLHERLLGEDEWSEPSPATGVIAAASAPHGIGELHEIMERLEMLAREGADKALVEELFAAIAPGPVTRARVAAL